MKTGLVAALAAAILLLGSLVYWRTRPARGSAPEIQAPPAAVASGSGTVLSEEVTGPERTAGSADTPETARSLAAPDTAAPPALVGDLATPSEIPGGVVPPAIPASIEESQRAESEVFEKRYQGKSLEERRAAQESLRVLLSSNQQGDLGKELALTDEQIQEFKREIDWLTLHEVP